MKEGIINIVSALVFSVMIVLGTVFLAEYIEKQEPQAAVSFSNSKEIIPIVLIEQNKNPVLIMNPRVDKIVADEILKSVEMYCYPFPKELIISLIYRESSFNPLSESKSGCLGLMQICPKQHPEKVRGYDRNELFSININIKIGCQILREYYERNKDIRKALISYLGAKNKSYVNDVLTGFTNFTIEDERSSVWSNFLLITSE